MSVYRGMGRDEAPEQQPADIPENPVRQSSMHGKTGAGMPDPAAMLKKLLPNGIDSDTLLIAALLLLLLKEGGDIRLVLALGYILL